MNKCSFVLKPFLTENEIHRLCKNLAAKIDADYKHLSSHRAIDCVTKEPDIVAICILKGGFFFIADLLRYSSLPFITDFVKLSSYGKGTKSNGTVTIQQDISTNIKNKHIIVFDEIVDSGKTLSFYLERLKASSPASIKICALIDKVGCRHPESKVVVDYAGMQAGEEFLVGYGLDYAENFRNLPDIYQVIFK
jgi:hypoxanthine phosphoribosyltransferase